MASIPFLNNLNMSQYSIENAAFQLLGTAPATPVAGQFYVHSDDTLRFRNTGDTAWVTLSPSGGGTVTSVGLTLEASLGNILSVTGSPVTGDGDLNLNLDAQTGNVVLSSPSGGGSGDPTFRSLVAADIPSLLHTKISDFDSGVQTNRLDQMAAPTSNVSMNSNKITGLTDPTGTGEAATWDYVNAAVTGALTHKGGYNAATNTPTLDTGSPVLEIGDMYTVTVAGTFFSEPLEVGDVLISDVDSSDAASFADWTIVQSNLDQATEGTPGFAAIATSGEVTTGTNDTKFVTPAKLEGWNGSTNITSVGTIGAGTWNGTDIAFANIAQLTGYSIAGKTGTGTGDMASIAAGVDGVLRRSGSGNLIFGSLVTNNYGASSVTYAKIQNASAGFTIMAKATTGSGAYAELASGTNGVLRRSGSGNLAFGTLVTANIGDDQITYAKIQNVVNDDRLLGRISGANGIIEELTGTQVASLIPDAGNTQKGLLRKYTGTTVGGSASETVTHNLGTADVVCVVTVAASGQVVHVDQDLDDGTSNNTLDLNFGADPGTAYNYVIFG